MRTKAFKYAGINMFFLLVLIFTQCEKMEDTYRQFYEDGETVYVGKADSILASPGRNRIELSWLLMSDPKVTSYKIYWNNRKDSITGQLTKTAEIDTVRVLLSDMEENIYHFEVYHYDEDGNSSIAASTLGRVYGDKYQQSIIQRRLESVLRERRDVVFQWDEAETDVLGVEVEYVNQLGVTNKHFVIDDVIVDTVLSVKYGTEIKYRTAFLPAPTAIDTFYTEYETLMIDLPIPTDGLVAHYPLNNDALDYSVNKNHAVHVSASPTTNRDNEPEKAFRFDGVGDYIEIPAQDFLSIANTGQLTISLWMRPDVTNFVNYESSGYVNFFAKGEVGQYEYTFRINNENVSSSSRITTYAYNLSGSGRSTYVQEIIQPSEWMHIVVVYDYLNNKIDIYKNGTYVRGATNYTSGYAPAIGTAPLRIATRDFGSYFEGAFDDLRIYNRVLTAGEIRTLYNE